ncbi:AAA family ATPase [uncultured Pseudomonas sp.]|uniref:AAA family ATPase n=1 Tax=uncultured Pseudomonas sp. TaxID=114707 RepID=UPI0025F483CD|nr:AAA family ATPase [uncultured Pseudomonas sp.]
MINKLKIENFKSIKSIGLSLGRINVFIGENGAGKSNILEAIALAGAASADKLDNEFLSSRGIRVTAPSLMKCAFEESEPSSPIIIKVIKSKETITYTLTNDEQPYSKWAYTADHEYSGTMTRDAEEIKVRIRLDSFLDSLTTFMANTDLAEEIKKQALHEFSTKWIEQNQTVNTKKTSKKSAETAGIVTVDGDNAFAKYIADSVEKNKKKDMERARQKTIKLSDFIIFSPENTALRDYQKEGQILPLGINGEGLLQLIEVESKYSGSDYLERLNDFLSLFGWFRSFSLATEPSAKQPVDIGDIYICDSRNKLDMRSANEGFLFLVFYFALFSSKLTPDFFAIDNIDASLNPKLCKKLIEELAKLAVKHDKQVLLTTHNPAILDGLNLDEDEQRLFVISRAMEGETKVRRIFKPKSVVGAPPLKLSEAFMRGSLGGLPKGF